MDNLTILLPLYQRNDLEQCFERVISSCFNGRVFPVEVIIVIDGPLNSSSTLIRATRKSFRRLLDYIFGA